jgi:hypothetical protein
VLLLRLLPRVILLVIAFYVIATAVRVYARKHYVFLPDYVRWQWSRLAGAGGPAAGPTHVFLLFVDHFEPWYDASKVQRWANRYRALARQHRDAAGRPPQHTWFYPGEQKSERILGMLGGLAGEGLGEVELHFHHRDGTSEALRHGLRAAIADFQRFGLLKTVDGLTRFAFIHGNASLDDSEGSLMCGVRTEIQILRELGCFGDFTFPSVFQHSQPPFVNAIYAAQDDHEAKSYRRRLPLTHLRDGTADLMIFQGPLVYAPSLNVRRLFLDLEDGDIHAAVPASPKRVDRWVRARVHVPARPDWVFVKIWGHGVSTEGDIEATVGPTFDEALSYLERRYNDGRDHVLHYVTAREAYNLARAAAEGATGDPDEYLDAYIPRYVSDRRPSPRVVSN